MSGLPLLTGCEIQGLFRNFQDLFEQIQGLSVPNKTHYILKSFIILYINSPMHELYKIILLLRKNQASIYDFKHCYIEDIVSIMTNSSFYFKHKEGQGAQCPRGRGATLGLGGGA